MILSAPSGAGKTTLARLLAEASQARGEKMAFSVSYTTRAPRLGEKDGIDYHFVDDARFSEMIESGDFLEHAGVFGKRYGTGRQATQELLAANDWVILDIDWQGARQVRKQWPDVFSVFIQPPSTAELERRLRSRQQDSEDVIQNRMAEAEAEMSHAPEFDVSIVNDDLQRALKDLELAMKQRVESQASNITST